MPLPGSLSFSHFLRGGRFAPTGYWGSSSLALTIGFRSRQADSQCGYPIACLFRHAIVPSPFRVQVGRMTWQVSHSCRLIVRQNDQAVTRRTPRSTMSPSVPRSHCFMLYLLLPVKDNRAPLPGAQQKKGPRWDPSPWRRYASAPELIIFYQVAVQVSRYMAESHQDVQNRMIHTVLCTASGATKV